MTTDDNLSSLLSDLILNEARIEGAPDAERERVENEGNDLRAVKEEELFGTQASSMRGIAVKLRALWPDISATGRHGGSRYNEPPAADEELFLHRVWGLIQEAERLASEEEPKLAKPSTTGLLDFYKNEAGKAGL